MAEGLPFVFLHRGRSHLKSKTVHSLLRILSLCGEESHSSHTHPIAVDGLNSGVHSEKSEKITAQEGHNENLSIENGLMSNKSVEVIPIEPTTSPVENDMIANEIVALFNNQSDQLEESRQGDEEIKLDEPLNYELSEAIKPTEDTQVRFFSSQQNVVEEVAHEVQQKETGLTEPVNLDTAMDSSVCLITDAEIEDGEIPDDLGVYGQSIDLLHEDFALLEEMKDGEDQISGEVFKQRESDNAQNHVASTFCHASTTDSLNACMQKKLEERKNEEKHVRDDIRGCGRGGDVEQADGGDRMPETRRNARGGDEAIWGVSFPPTYVDSLGNALKTSDQGSAPKVKEPKVRERIKKTLTKERKEKRKRSEKKRRAKKNRELGVKRLKIEPISKPKVVKYCEFFLKGRCQKGDSCKFSHDTVPLTKSQPCTFFARNSCMKGDDCPFDHQLFKYPCDNYISKGDCNRGDKCKFSHKLVEKPTPSSNIKHTEAGSASLPCNSNAKRQQNTKNTYSQTLDNVSKETSLRTPSSAGTLVQRNPVVNVSGRLKTPAQAPKGVTFLSFGSSPTDDSDNRDVQKDQNASEKPQNSNELLWKTPAQAPKGVAFFSFGSSPMDDSNNRVVQKDQIASEKPQNSNELLWKTPATRLPLHRSATNPSPNGQNNNSAQRALSSTLAFAAKYEKEMMKSRSICSPGLNNEANKTTKSSTSSSIDTVQNGWMKASPLLQEFLFGAGGDGN